MKKFERIVFDAFSEMDNYDEVLYRMQQIRKHMVAGLPSFSKMSVRMQYEYCCQIFLMITATVTGQIKRDRPLTPNNDGGGKYDVISRFVPAEVITITTHTICTTKNH